MIKFHNVSKTFDGGKTFIVNNISFECAEGETLVLLGSSGCGKTTTLKMINKLIKPTSGDIYLKNKPINDMDSVDLRRSIGYTFQGVGLFPHMTIEENIGIVLRLNKIPLEERLQRAYQLLKMVNLNPQTFAKRFPHQLSGGQQQRVGVARSLAANPSILLMDEPFGALDAINREGLQNELLQLKEQIKITLVFVTHDIFEAFRLGDKIAVMNKGRIEQLADKNTIINRPATAFVTELLEKPRNQLAEFADQLNLAQG